MAQDAKMVAVFALDGKALGHVLKLEARFAEGEGHIVRQPEADPEFLLPQLPELVVKKEPVEDVGRTWNC